LLRLTLVAVAVVGEPGIAFSPDVLAGAGGTFGLDADVGQDIEGLAVDLDAGRHRTCGCRAFDQDDTHHHLQFRCDSRPDRRNRKTNAAIEIGA
jgi:hypothetical protein